MERDQLPSDAANRRTSLLLALAAGVGFGFSFVCYGNTRDASEFWPVLSGRVGAVLAVLVVVAATRTHIRLAGTPRYQAIAAGALDIVATTLLLVAIRDGLFATVAPVAALAPAFTVAQRLVVPARAAIDHPARRARTRAHRTRAHRRGLTHLADSADAHARCRSRRPLRIAVVGLGQISELVLPTYLERDDVEIVGLCDHDDERLERWRAGVPATR